MAAATAGDDEDEQYAAFFQGRHALSQLLGLHAAATKDLWSCLRIIYETAWFGCLSRVIAEWRRKQRLERKMCAIAEESRRVVLEKERVASRQLEVISTLKDEVVACWLSAAQNDRQVSSLQEMIPALSTLFRRCCVYGVVGVMRREETVRHIKMLLCAHDCNRSS